MKLVTFEGNSGEERLGALVGTAVLDLLQWDWLREAVRRPTRAACAMSRLLAAGPACLERIAEEAARAADGPADRLLPLESLQLKAPVPWPNKLLLLAGNYAESAHADTERTTTPYVFSKPPATTVIGSGEPIPIPRNGRFVDYELELAVVVGRTVRFADIDQAHEAIAGYTILNDISEREFHPEARTTARPWDQFFDWLAGKWFDGFAPMGPCIVTADELPRVDDLRMELRVNGEVRQQATPGEMVYGPAELVAWISSICTLEPGDVIATGTPPGIGKASGQRLTDGDVVEAEIEGIGVLSNPVRALAGTPGH